MSVPNKYFGHGSHMSAVLKRDIHRVRTSKPALYKTARTPVTSMDGEGRVTTTVVEHVRAVPISGKARHALSIQKERF